MRKEEWKAAIQNKKLKRRRDWSDWLGDLLGLYTVSVLWIVCVFLFFQKTNGDNTEPLFYVVAGTLPLYAVYCLSRENDLTPIEVSLGTNENRKLVVAAFRALKWDVHTNTKYIVTAGANNKWWRGAGQTATALIDHDRIYLNVIHGGTIKGRLPFYFGSNQRKLERAIVAIKAAALLP